MLFLGQIDRCLLGEAEVRSDAFHANFQARNYAYILFLVYSSVFLGDVHTLCAYSNKRLVKKGVNVIVLLPILIGTLRDFA